MDVLNLNDELSESFSGAKAFHLSKMKREGFPVPEGFVILSTAFEKYKDIENDFPEEFIYEIRQELSKVNANNYMVRSSAIGEDSLDNSFAGQLSSYVSTNQEIDILSNLKLCWKSYYNNHLATYQKQSGKQLKGMAVVVQALIDPDYAGVIFTRNPENETEMLVEFVEGHGEKLVSGEINPKSFVVNNKLEMSNKFNYLHFKKGIEIAKKLERFYQMPLDIEWAIKDSIFYVVQARPITTEAKGKKVYWSNTNVNENYPEAITPLLYSIARDSYHHYFKNLSRLFLIPNAKISELESCYSNVISAFGCKMYYNMSSIHEIIMASPFSKMLSKSFDNFVGYTKMEHQQETVSLKSKVAFVLKVLKFNFNLEKTVQDFETLAQKYEQQVDAAISFSDLRLAFHQFIEIRMYSWYKASLADFFAMLYHGSLGKFCKMFYGNESEGIHNKLIQAIPNIVSSKPILLIHKIIVELRSNTLAYQKFYASNPEEFFSWLAHHQKDSKLTRLINDYLKNWGFRCSGELMLTMNNYLDEPKKFIELLKQYEGLPDRNPQAIIASKFEERNIILKEFERKIYAKNHLLFPISWIQIAVLKLLIKLASKGISARERVRLKQALIYYKFKQIILKTGNEFRKRKLLANEEDIYFLSYQEITELFSSSMMLTESLNKRIDLRKSDFEQSKQLVFPDDFSSFQGEYPNLEKIKKEQSTPESNGNSLKGLSVCGGMVKGQARVLHSVMEASKLKQGDILVTRQTDPGWVVVFPLISGLIVERGGMLSHGAIVSREFGIPAIVGIEDVTKKIKDGDYIVLNAETGIITFENE